jgi:hypothetical protein
MPGFEFESDMADIIVDAVEIGGVGLVPWP